MRRAEPLLPSLRLAQQYLLARSCLFVGYDMYESPFPVATYTHTTAGCTTGSRYVLHRVTPQENPLRPTRHNLQVRLFQFKGTSCEMKGEHPGSDRLVSDMRHPYRIDF